MVHSINCLSHHNLTFSPHEFSLQVLLCVYMYTVSGECASELGLGNGGGRDRQGRQQHVLCVSELGCDCYGILSDH